MRFRIFPVFLIGLGGGLLLTKLGILPGDEMRMFFHTWWPALLVALGASMLLFPRERCGHWRHRHDGAPQPTREPKVTSG